MQLVAHHPCHFRQGILLVYDVTDRGSFNSIRNWVGQIQQVGACKIICLGNWLTPALISTPMFT
jgi:hypothetical protein